MDWEPHTLTAVDGGRSLDLVWLTHYACAKHSRALGSVMGDGVRYFGKLGLPSSSSRGCFRTSAEDEDEQLRQIRVLRCFKERRHLRLQLALDGRAQTTPRQA
jgi:hypothetical protein